MRGVRLLEAPAVVSRVAWVPASPPKSGSFGQALPLDSEEASADEPILSELQRPDDPQPDVPGFYGDMQSVLVDTQHYIRRGDGEGRSTTYARIPLS